MREEMITLSDEERQEMLERIKTFFRDEREEEIGIIASGDVLDFFVGVLGKSFYNKALDDAWMWFRKMNDNMESDFYSLYKDI